MSTAGPGLWRGSFSRVLQLVVIVYFKIGTDRHSWLAQLTGRNQMTFSASMTCNSEAGGGLSPDRRVGGTQAKVFRGSKRIIASKSFLFYTKQRFRDDFFPF